MRLVFFGTPAFAVPSLEVLLASGHDVAAVVTQPDRPQGRHHSSLVPPPVKVTAQAAGVPVLQPERPRGEAFLAWLEGLRADLGVVAAYGHILRPEVLAAPRLGMVNVHASLLPRHRGAAPIQWAIRAGDPETGVTIMRMEAGLDSGPMIHARRTPISREDTGGSLTERLARLGAEALGAALPAILDGSADEAPQDPALATYAPKVDRETARIPWAEPAEVVDRHIRAFDPVPGAWTTLGEQDVKLSGSRVAEAHVGAPGEVLDAGERELLVACGTGVVAVREAQPAGKRRQPVGDWVRGRGIATGRQFL